MRDITDAADCVHVALYLLLVMQTSIDRYTKQLLYLFLLFGLSTYVSFHFCVVDAPLTSHFSESGGLPLSQIRTATVRHFAEFRR